MELQSSRTCNHMASNILGRFCAVKGIQLIALQRFNSYGELATPTGLQWKRNYLYVNMYRPLLAFHGTV